MAEETKVEVVVKKAEATPPPFAIRRKIVMGEGKDQVEFLPGDEDKLRPKLDAANFNALVEQRAIAKLEPKAPRPKP